MTANVAIRSNVRVGSLSDLKAHGVLVSAVSGRSALKKLLRRLEPGKSELEAAEQHLSPQQIAQLVQDACSDCGFFTVGPVRSADGPVLQVRCPRRECEATIRPTKEVLLDGEMANNATLTAALHGLDLSGVIAKALWLSASGARTSLDRDVRRVALRLPHTLHYRFYGWDVRSFSEVVKTHLREFVRHG
jgi:hypothetical protein